MSDDGTFLVNRSEGMADTVNKKANLVQVGLLNIYENSFTYSLFAVSTIAGISAAPGIAAVVSVVAPGNVAGAPGT